MARSLDAAMEEERREVLSLLESAAASKARPAPLRTSSPAYNTRSPRRSMLDIAEGSSTARTTRPVSMTPSNVGTTQPPVRSMLDINGPPSASWVSSRKISFPAEQAPQPTGEFRARSMSDAMPRTVERNTLVRPDPTADYQFAGILPSHPGGPKVAKRNTRAGAQKAGAEGGRSTDLGALGSRSKSPHSRLGALNHSVVAASARSAKDKAAMLALDDGTLLDKNSAYRRLSDANLARSGGILSKLSRPNSGRPAADGTRASNRLEKDYTFNEGEGIVESSDEDPITSDDDGARGRRKGSNQIATGSDPEATTLGMGKGKGPRTSLSLLAAAEEERQDVEQKYKVKSLLDPAIKITGPYGDRVRTRYIHPSTSFDQGGLSGVNTPITSDTEADIKDIVRAQKLTVNLTPVQSYPSWQRCVRTIYRGDFAQMQENAQEDQRRIRKYLVATDLSDEAQHAMEWTIGTVLRDGDTLLAIYCVDEESGMGLAATADHPTNHSSAEEAMMKEQAAFVAATAVKPPMANATSSSAMPSPLGFGDRGARKSSSPSPSGRARSKAEQDRHHAIRDITDRVVKLLRKTRLQVRVVVEVIHCKSPKHLITEVIDYINPTLVILGSRGRSALKGVILGSFSNYLVTKSSVPVMVARKKLRKHNKFKTHSSAISKLTNNLTKVSAGTLAAAKVD